MAEQNSSQQSQELQQLKAAFFDCMREIERLQLARNDIVKRIEQLEAAARTASTPVPQEAAPPPA